MALWAQRRKEGDHHKTRARQQEEDRPELT